MLLRVGLQGQKAAQITRQKAPGESRSVTEPSAKCIVKTPTRPTRRCSPKSRGRPGLIKRLQASRTSSETTTTKKGCAPHQVQFGAWMKGKASKHAQKDSLASSMNEDREHHACHGNAMMHSGGGEKNKTKHAAPRSHHRLVDARRLLRRGRLAPAGQA